jgi:hypothetical protein
MPTDTELLNYLIKESYNYWEKNDGLALVIPDSVIAIEYGETDSLDFQMEVRKIIAKMMEEVEE